MLPAETVASEPFSSLISLEKAVANRILTDSGAATDKEELPWLHAFGAALLRVTLEDDEKTAEAREAGKRFIEIRLCLSPSIQVTPYFEDKPAGTAKNQEIAWIAQTVFTVALSSARLARLLPEHLGRTMPTDGLREALYYCYDRPVQDVVRYMEENFDLTAEYSPSSPEVHPQPPGEKAGTPDPPPVDQPDPTPTGEQPLSGDPPETPPHAPKEPELDPTPPKNRKPSGPSLMERFALSTGFHRVGETFVHPDGSRLVKEADGGFGWYLNDAASGNGRHFRAVDACLERHGVEIPYETWTAIEREPDTHSLILLDHQGLTKEVTGDNLCRMKQEGVVKLFPATYRLKRT